jgi:cysteine protease ATG4
MTPSRPLSWQGTVAGSPPALASAMEAAMASAAEVSRVSRRILQKIWDPEPVNNRSANTPVWCLGQSYTLDTKTYGSLPPPIASLKRESPAQDSADKTEQAPLPSGASSGAPDTPPDSVASSFDSSLAYEDPGQDGGWPPAFLEDFESRIWMTYRTSFESIPRSTDPKAAGTLSFAMRLKSTLQDPSSGFCSDTGWGCMIRSGQSLLANAVQVTRLGRGIIHFHSGCCSKRTCSNLLSHPQTGGAAKMPMPRGKYCAYSPTILAPPIPSITS